MLWIVIRRPWLTGTEMTSMPTPENVRDLSREELIELVLQQADIIRQLHAEVERLKNRRRRRAIVAATVAGLETEPGRGETEQETRGETRPRESRTPAGGAARYSHRSARDDLCPVWTDLRGVAPQRTLRRQITNCLRSSRSSLRPAKTEVECPCCHQLQHGVLPEGLEATRQFGPRLDGLVTYFTTNITWALSVSRRVLQDVLEIAISEGGAVRLIERAGEAAEPEADAIGERVKQSRVIGSDETSARVHGRNWWEWVFTNQADGVSRDCPQPRARRD